MLRQLRTGAIAGLLTVTFIMAGCTATSGSSRSSATATGSGTHDRTPTQTATAPIIVSDTFLRDIPVPADYRLAEDQTYLFETKNGMILAGRTYDGRIASESVVAIYRREMPRNGWTLDSTSISANQINKLYYKDGAMALITITTRFGGSSVSIRYSSLNPRSSNAATPPRPPARSAEPASPAPRSGGQSSASDEKLPETKGIIYIDDLNP